jgi:hypothetical protein
LDQLATEQVATEAQKPEDTPLDDVAIKLQETAEKIHELSAKNAEQLHNFNIRVSGYLLIGNAVGIVTVFQYLIYATNTTTITSLLATIAMVVLAAGVTTSCGALAVCQRDLTDSYDWVGRVSKNIAKMYLTIRSPVGTKRSSDLTPADSLTIEKAIFCFIDDLGYGFKLIKPASTSEFHRWLRVSVALFLIGLWTALLAAAEHLWHWSKHAEAVVGHS